MSTWEQCQPGFRPVLSWPSRIFSMISPTSSNCGKERRNQVGAKSSRKVEPQQHPASPGHLLLRPFECPGATWTSSTSPCVAEPAPTLLYACHAQASLPLSPRKTSLDSRTQFSQPLGHWTPFSWWSPPLRLPSLTMAAAHSWLENRLGYQKMSSGSAHALSCQPDLLLGSSKPLCLQLPLFYMPQITVPQTQHFLAMGLCTASSCPSTFLFFT